MTIDQQAQEEATVNPTVLLSLAAARARHRLGEAPGLVAYVRTLITPAGAQRSDGLPRPASKEAPAPLRVDAVDESDAAYAQLLNWVAYWSETLHIAPPVTAAYAWSNSREVQGFRAGVTPEGAAVLVRNSTVWLLLHQDKIERHQQASAYFEDVASIVWDLRKKFPRDGRGPRPVFPRACPVCGDPSMGVEWHSEQLQDFTLVCSYCGFKGDTAALLKERDLAELLRDMRSEEVAEPTKWWTKKQAAREMRITPQTLNRYIQQDGLNTHTADGAVYVNADQLREIWRGKRMRDQNPRAERQAS
ncbi:hypothetical protein EDF28_3577 [Curtobacterium sp. PhB137]|uniref:hypothetical protein n=1 Tax=Curtobacterium sp. PhB137 TaxID=2485182 RepID=UPI000F4FEDBE|nr:hypothetical protein [Curtobacterium sp. PhB137]RPE75632.1 hypothetical protein EDF28_3577 [Curtobacterium sp. PhB137]